MGLLDDAIREHLDLKRRRGADPSEVDRLEREALGPVRRAPHDAPDLLTDDAPSYPTEEEEAVADWELAPDEALPFDHAADAAPEPAPAEWSEAERPPDPGAPPAASFEPEVDAPGERRSDLPRHHEIAEEWEAHERQGLSGEPAGSEPDEPGPAAPAPVTPPPAAATPSFEEETAEYKVENEEDFARPAEPTEGEDVLEETPDFLQDTPDHDRLWFEQRPPRDFDFDK